MEGREFASSNPQPFSMGGLLTLPIRPSKRIRSLSSSGTGRAPSKRIREAKSSEPSRFNDAGFRFFSGEAPPLAHNWKPILKEPSDGTDYFSLRYPAMLRPLSKRRRLPIPEQFIHPVFFVRHLNQKHPEFDFTVLQYHKAWHCAVDLAINNLDLSHGGLKDAKNLFEEGVRAAHGLIERVRLKTKAGYALGKQVASPLWVTANAARFHKQLADKRRKKGQWRFTPQAHGSEMEIEKEDESACSGREYLSSANTPRRLL